MRSFSLQVELDFCFFKCGVIMACYDDSSFVFVKVLLDSCDSWTKQEPRPCLQMAQKGRAIVLEG